MFYGIEVRALWWPLQCLDFVVLKPFCQNFGSCLLTRNLLGVVEKGVLMTPSILFCGKMLWQNGLRTTKSRHWNGHHKALTSIPKKSCGQNWKSVCEQGGLQTWLSYISSVRRNGPKFTQLIVGSLWKVTQNGWPKLNNLKAMLPNTNWVYVNWECDERNKSWNK